MTSRGCLQQAKSRASSSGFCDPQKSRIFFSKTTHWLLNHLSTYKVFLVAGGRQTPEAGSLESYVRDPANPTWVGTVASFYNTLYQRLVSNPGHIKSLSHLGSTIVDMIVTELCARVGGKMRAHKWHTIFNSVYSDALVLAKDALIRAGCCEELFSEGGFRTSVVYQGDLLECSVVLMVICDKPIELFELAMYCFWRHAAWRQTVIPGPAFTSETICTTADIDKLSLEGQGVVKHYVDYCIATAFQWKCKYLDDQAAMVAATAQNMVVQPDEEAKLKRELREGYEPYLAALAAVKHIVSTGYQPVGEVATWEEIEAIVKAEVGEGQTPEAVPMKIEGPAPMKVEPSDSPSDEQVQTGGGQASESSSAPARGRKAGTKIPSWMVKSPVDNTSFSESHEVQRTLDNTMVQASLFTATTSDDYVKASGAVGKMKQVPLSEDQQAFISNSMGFTMLLKTQNAHKQAKTTWGRSVKASKGTMTEEELSARIAENAPVISVGLKWGRDARDKIMRQMKERTGRDIHACQLTFQAPLESAKTVGSMSGGKVTVTGGKQPLEPDSDDEAPGLDSVTGLTGEDSAKANQGHALTEPGESSTGGGPSKVSGGEAGWYGELAELADLESDSDTNMLEEALEQEPNSSQVFASKQAAQRRMLSNPGKTFVD